MAETAYRTEDIIVRAEIQNAAPYAAGTYKKGQLLGRVTATGAFKAYTAGASDGSQIIAALCPQDMTASAANPTGPIARGEFSRKGVAAVMASLTPAVTVDDPLAGQCWDAGIILN
jgi:hypothetical protein